MAIAFAITFLLVLFWGAKEAEEGAAEQYTGSEKTAEQPGMPENRAETEIVSPLDGEAVPLSEVPDPTFAQEMLGKGIAIRPSGNTVCSPVDGKVTMIFPTRHAVGLESEDGAELLIHIGLDTVQLEGKYFTAAVCDGQKVKKGDPLITCDLDKVVEAGYQTITPVIVTNTDLYTEITPLASGRVKTGDALLKIR